MIKNPERRWGRVNDMEESHSPFISATLHPLALSGKQAKDGNTFHSSGMEAWSFAQALQWLSGRLCLAWLRSLTFKSVLLYCRAGGIEKTEDGK